jgi:hypothetical protein
VADCIGNNLGISFTEQPKARRRLAAAPVEVERLSLAALSPPRHNVRPRKEGADSIDARHDKDWSSMKALDRPLETSACAAAIFAVFPDRTNRKEGIPRHEQISRISIAFHACLHSGLRIWGRRAGD